MITSRGSSLKAIAGRGTGRSNAIMSGSSPPHPADISRICGHEHRSNFKATILQVIFANFTSLPK